MFTVRISGLLNPGASAQVGLMAVTDAAGQIEDPAEDFKSEKIPLVRSKAPVARCRSFANRVPIADS
jgi:hypothetical protein